MAFQMDSTRAVHFTDSIAAWPVGMVWSLGIRAFIPPPLLVISPHTFPQLPLLTPKNLPMISLYGMYIVFLLLSRFLSTLFTIFYRAAWNADAV